VDGFHLRFADYLSRTIDGKHPVRFFSRNNFHFIFQNWRGVIDALTDLKDHVAYSINMSSNEALRDKKL
jgi:hypothetical protein